MKVTGESLIQRKDDTAAVLKSRLEAFHKQTEPVWSFILCSSTFLPQSPTPQPPLQFFSLSILFSIIHLMVLIKLLFSDVDFCVCILDPINFYYGTYMIKIERVSKESKLLAIAPFLFFYFQQKLLLQWSYVFCISGNSI